MTEDEAVDSLIATSSGVDAQIANDLENSGKRRTGNTSQCFINLGVIYFGFRTFFFLELLQFPLLLFFQLLQLFETRLAEMFASRSRQHNRLF